MDVKESPLVQGALEARRPTRWWLGWVLVMVVGVIAIPAVVSSVVLSLMGNPPETSAKGQWTEFFTNGTTLLLLAAWVIFKERRRFSSIGFRRPGWWQGLAGGLVIGVAMVGLAVLLLTLFGAFASGESRHTATGTAALGTVLSLMIVWAVQASTEEAVTRGYMLQTAGSQTNALVAVFGLAAVFAVAHLDFRPLVLINIALFSLLASFLSLARGTLWLACGIHIGWNASMGNVFGLPVSGTPRDVSLWSFGPKPDAPSWLTGSDFGIEGGVITTFIWGAAALTAFLYYRRARAHRAPNPANPRHATVH